MTVSIENLCDLIREKSPDAIRYLAGYSQLNVCSEQGHTPFNSAISVDNRPVIDFLALIKNCLNYAPAIDPALKNPVKFTVNKISASTIELEEKLKNTFGPNINFVRTPLLQACRSGNLYAINVLLLAGAKVNQKDILNKTCLELCFESGGIELAQGFINTCKACKIHYKVSREELQQALTNKNYYDNLIQLPLDTAALRFAFNLACAYLDIEKITSWLNSGIKISSMFGEHNNPVIEAVTSYALHVHNLPDPDNFAHLFTREKPDNPLPLDTAKAESDYLDRLQSDDKRRDFLERPKSLRIELAKLYARKRNSGLTEIARNKQLIKRLELLDMLFNSGVTAEQIESQYFYYYPEYFFCMGEVEILDRLQKYGLSLAMDTDRKEDLLEELSQRNLPNLVQYLQTIDSGIKKTSKFKALESSANYWELSGETNLLAACLPDRPQSDQEFILRLTLGNNLWPQEKTSIKVQTEVINLIIDPVTWKDLKLVEELIFLPGEASPSLRSEVKRLPKTEVPWSGTYEVSMQLPTGEHRLNLQVQLPDEPVIIINDWVIKID